jgi:hypothetical protein
MMLTVSTILVYLAFAGAAASWIAGAVYFVLTLREISGDRRLMWMAIVAWPFATSQIRGQGAVYAANVNKALVAFIACILVGMAAFAASANLHRFAK